MRVAKNKQISTRNYHKKLNRNIWAFLRFLASLSSSDWLLDNVFFIFIFFSKKKLVYAFQKNLKSKKKQIKVEAKNGWSLKPKWFINFYERKVNGKSVKRSFCSTCERLPNSRRRINLISSLPTFLPHSTFDFKHKRKDI